MSKAYEIMHKDCCVAMIDRSGHTRIYDPSFVPFDLGLTTSTDFDMMINNVLRNARIFFVWLEKSKCILTSAIKMRFLPAVRPAKVVYPITK